MKIRIKVPTRLAESLEDKARKAVEEAKEAVANAKKEKQLKQLEELKAKVDDKIAMLKGKKGKKQKVEEGLINEGIIDLSQTAVDLLMDKNKFATKPGSSTGVFTVYDLSRPKGAASFGDDMASQKVGFLYTPESKYKAYKLESDDENTVKKITALKESQLDEEEQLGVGYKFANGQEIKYAVGTKFYTSSLPGSTMVKPGVWVITKYQPNGNIEVKCESGEAEGKTGLWNMGSLQNFLKLGLKLIEA